MSREETFLLFLLRLFKDCYKLKEEVEIDPTFRWDDRIF